VEDLLEEYFHNLLVKFGLILLKHRHHHLILLREPCEELMENY
jgi:hypothetical protein